MTGPCGDFGPNLYTWICILGAGIPYLIFIMPYLFSDFSPVLAVINVILFVATILFLILTGFTDPGIIPRKNMIILQVDEDNRLFYE